MHQPQRIVIKLGTNLLTGGKNSLDLKTIEDIIKQIASMKISGGDVLIVSSGAVAACQDPLSRTPGKDKLQRGTIAYRQALAALGQPQLMMAFEQLAAKHDFEVAQALISRGDLQSRSRYLNIRNTLDALLAVGAVPILNENDVVAVEELTGDVYGDNDRLSAMLANTLDADLLILLGEIDGLHTTDPKIDPDSKLIDHVTEITDDIQQSALGPSDQQGSGGMTSKLEAARISMDLSLIHI